VPTNQELIWKAIAERLQVVALYDGHRREMCPHAMGWKNGEMRVLCFQFGGATSNGAVPPRGEWKCMEVDRLIDISLRQGLWRTGGWHSRQQTCIDQVVLRVSDVSGSGRSRT
jgi:hypothetical protein